MSWGNAKQKRWQSCLLAIRLVALRMTQNTDEGLSHSPLGTDSERGAPTSIERGKLEDPTDIPSALVPYIVASGLCMGTADVVPGVSGGTMAVALGIYRRLLVAIASINKHSVQALVRFRLKETFEILHWRFLASLGSGILLAVVIMIKVVKLPELIETSPQAVYSVFFGLVGGSVIILGRRIPKWTVLRVMVGLVSILVGFLIVNLVPVSTPDSMLFVFLCGVIAISAMLLPGISGSFILLILGKYEYVLHAVEGLMHFDLSQLKVVVPFALGCLVGLAAFSRFLTWLMRRWHDTVIASLCGLLVGSLWRIWPYQELKKELVHGKLKTIEAHAFWPDSLDVSAVLLVIGGLAAVLLIEYLANRRRTRFAS